MHGVWRFNDWISVNADIAPKNIRLADKLDNFGWNSAEPEKFRRRRGACYKSLAAAAAQESSM